MASIVYQNPYAERYGGKFGGFSKGGNPPKRIQYASPYAAQYGAETTETTEATSGSGTINTNLSSAPGTNQNNVLQPTRTQRIVLSGSALSVLQQQIKQAKGLEAQGYTAKDLINPKTGAGVYLTPGGAELRYYAKNGGNQNANTSNTTSNTKKDIVNNPSNNMYSGNSDTNQTQDRLKNFYTQATNPVIAGQTTRITPQNYNVQPNLTDYLVSGFGKYVMGNKEATPVNVANKLNVAYRTKWSQGIKKFFEKETTQAQKSTPSFIQKNPTLQRIATSPMIVGNKVASAIATDIIRDPESYPVIYGLGVGVGMGIRALSKPATAIATKIASEGVVGESLIAGTKTIVPKLLTGTAAVLLTSDIVSIRKSPEPYAQAVQSGKMWIIGGSGLSEGLKGSQGVAAKTLTKIKNTFINQRNSLLAAERYGGQFITPVAAKEISTDFKGYEIKAKPLEAVEFRGLSNQEGNKGLIYLRYGETQTIKPKDIKLANQYILDIQGKTITEVNPRASYSSLDLRKGAGPNVINLVPDVAAVKGKGIYKAPKLIGKPSPVPPPTSPGELPPYNLINPVQGQYIVTGRDLNRIIHNEPFFFSSRPGTEPGQAIKLIATGKLKGLDITINPSQAVEYQKLLSGYGPKLSQKEFTQALLSGGDESGAVFSSKFERVIKGGTPVYEVNPFKGFKPQTYKTAPSTRYTGEYLIETTPKKVIRMSNPEGIGMTSKEWFKSIRRTAVKQPENTDVAPFFKDMDIKQQKSFMNQILKKGTKTNPVQGIIKNKKIYLFQDIVKPKSTSGTTPTTSGETILLQKQVPKTVGLSTTLKSTSTKQTSKLSKTKLSVASKQETKSVQQVLEVKSASKVTNTQPKSQVFSEAISRVKPITSSKIRTRAYLGKLSAQISNTQSKSALKPIQTTATKLKPITTQKISPQLKIFQLNKFQNKYAQKVENLLKLKTSTAQAYKTFTETNMITTPKIKTPKPTLKLPETKQTSKEIFSDIEKNKKIKSYLAYIFTKGKKVTIGRKLSRTAALDLVALKLKEKLSATGGITPTPGAPNRIKGTGTYRKFFEEFRTYKIRKGRKIPLKNRIIQRRAKRLGTRSETIKIQQAKKNKRGIYL